MKARMSVSRRLCGPWKTGRQQEQQTSGRGTFVPLVFGPGEAF